MAQTTHVGNLKGRRSRSIANVSRADVVEILTQAGIEADPTQPPVFTGDLPTVAIPVPEVVEEPESEVVNSDQVLEVAPEEVKSTTSTIPQLPETFAADLFALLDGSEVSDVEPETVEIESTSDVVGEVDWETIPPAGVPAELPLPKAEWPIFQPPVYVASTSSKSVVDETVEEVATTPEAYVQNPETGIWTRTKDGRHFDANFRPLKKPGEFGGDSEVNKDLESFAQSKIEEQATTTDSAKISDVPAAPKTALFGNANIVTPLASAQLKTGTFQAPSGETRQPISKRIGALLKRQVTPSKPDARGIVKAASPVLPEDFNGVPLLSTSLKDHVPKTAEDAAFKERIMRASNGSQTIANPDSPVGTGYKPAEPGLSQDL